MARIDTMPRRRLAAMALAGIMALALTASPGARAATLQDCQKGDLVSRIVACDDIINDPKIDTATRATALVSRGYAVFAQTGDTAEPLANFSSASLLDPTNAAAAIGLGTMHFTRKELDQAEAAFNAAIKLAPNDPTAWSSLGKVFETRGDTATALADYDKALAINKRHPGANLNKADALLKTGQKGEALAVYRFCLYLFDQRSQQYAYAQGKIAELETELGQ
jgi:Flp pilus assembly protein TadD